MEHDQVSGRWVHAHEEDTEDEMVFRPAGTDLPRLEAGSPSSFAPTAASQRPASVRETSRKRAPAAGSSTAT